MDRLEPKDLSDDTATEQFMTCFYKHLFRGESASESLHKARKWMRNNGFDKVSQWAPFMIMGDNVTFDFGNWPGCLAHLKSHDFDKISVAE